jgi:signal transduction histidine kinase
MRTPPRPHPHDVWIALAGLAGGLLGIAYEMFSFFPDRPHGPEVLAGVLLAATGELFRRTAPRAALGMAAAGFAIDVATGGLLAVLVMFTDVVYAAVLYGPARFGRAVTHGSAGLSVVLTVTAVAVTRDAIALSWGALCAAVTASPAWTGLIVRHHRDAAAAERLRAEQVALRAEMDRVQAVTAERARMARELHDLVAGRLSAIALHATAALTLDEPAATRRAVTVIRENSTQGLAEMRRLIGVLRTAGGEGAPEAVPTLDGLDALLRRAARDAAAAGLTVVGRDRRPPGGSLPAAVDLAAYRIVQEALVNALKHAAPGEVTVTVEQAGDDLTVTVVSPYRGSRRPRVPGTGSGLTGMRERAALLGGAFEAGPHGGTWRVRARLPVTGRVAA